MLAEESRAEKPIWFARRITEETYTMLQAKPIDVEPVLT